MKHYILILCLLDLDHTADIQVHAWGNSLEEAFVQSAHAMVDYMYERKSVIISNSVEISVEGSSLNRLLYNFLEEVLLIFSCDPYLAIGTVEITQNITCDENGIYRMKAQCKGEEYDRRKHGSKTEIKSVTFSNMLITAGEHGEKSEIYVIFDI